MFSVNYHPFRTDAAPSLTFWFSSFPVLSLSFPYQPQCKAPLTDTETFKTIHLHRRDAEAQVHEADLKSHWLKAALQSYWGTHNYSYLLIIHLFTLLKLFHQGAAKVCSWCRPRLHELLNVATDLVFPWFSALKRSSVSCDGFITYALRAPFHPFACLIF